MIQKFSPYRKTIPDLKAYEKSFKLGMSLAMNRKPLNLKLNPYSKFLRPASYFSFDLGLKLSYQRGIEIRENNSAYDHLKEERRKHDLKVLEKYQDKSKGKER